MLVVIAIIAIPAARLFPVFAQAREKARAIACLSDMKQIGTGITTYVQDYDETLPLAQAYGPVFNTDIAIEIGPYIQKINAFQANNAGVWKCPDDNIPPTSNGAAAPAGVVHRADAPVQSTGGRVGSAAGPYDGYTLQADGVT